MTAVSPVVFATPGAMAEHGAAARSAVAAVRRLLAAATTAARTRRRRPGHEEMARQRLVAQTLEAIRLGRDADAALGGPRLR